MDEQNLISIDRQDDVAIVTFNVPSISSVSSVDNISEKLRQVASNGKTEIIVVDFDGVRFFSSLVLGMLVDIWRRQKDSGGKLIVSGINPQLSRVFRITNLDTIFQFYPDKQAAIEGIKGD